MSKLLFVCTEGRHRSRTGAELFSPEHDTRFVGTHPSAERQLTHADVRWADYVIGMEGRHYRAARRLGADDARLVCLGIEDDYLCGNPVLKKMLLDLVPVALGNPPAWGDPQA